MPKINLKKIKNYLIIIFIIVYIGIFVFEGIFNFNQGVISNLLSRYQGFAGLIYVLLLTIGMAVGLLTAVIVFSGFFVFNFSELIILTIIGVILGISLIFILARVFGHKAFMEYLKVHEKRKEKLKELFTRDSTALTILFNFIFFLPSTFGGIVGGLADIKLYKFIPISIIGNLINQIAFIFLLYGTQNGKMIFLIPSIIVLILNTLIPIIIYRKNIGDVFRIIFKRKEADKVITD